MADEYDLTRDRRRQLTVAPNPRSGLDYVVTLGGTLSLEGMPGQVTARVRYIPDRDTLAAPVFTRYLAALANAPWPDLETLGAAMLGDLNSELVPRWMQVVLLTTRSDDGEYSVLLEDRQPKWDNPRLLGRLKPY
ncbi:MAG: hypothetical protein CMM50_14395 [Rhodospirillaceae bacterium]|jgi:hypothetical protein|nr:hypothetical protein [Rhodospirillaceae bacterium]|tara:strand:- start:239 stop:643 length:405 start_codon:yes stop_codon:yes gene_type:complete